MPLGSDFILDTSGAPVARYDIIILTLDRPIPTSTDGWALQQSPWSGREPVDLTGAQISIATIEDDDDRFQSGLYTHDETQQRLVEDTVFGSGATREVVPAGTPLSNFVGALIADDRGGQFNVLFPRRLVPEDLGDEFGGRHSVLVLPVRNAAGVLPEFDPEAAFRFVRYVPLVAADDSLPYATCLTEGTLVQTASGLRPIETLGAGMSVVTLDRGQQAVLWAGRTRLGPEALDLSPNLRPIRIAAGALGQGRPARDLTVSPQHRILIRSRVSRRMTGETEVLVAARHLAGLPGVTVERPAAGVVYWHVLLEHHDLMLTEGAWTESLLPGPMALRALGPAHARRVRALTAGRSMPPARLLMPGRQARSLAARDGRNVHPLLEALAD